MDAGRGDSVERDSLGVLLWVLKEPCGDGSGGINISSSPIGTGGWYTRIGGAALSLNWNSGGTNGARPSTDGGDGITGDSDGVGVPYGGPGGITTVGCIPGPYC